MMPSLPQVLIIVAIVALLFGGKILRRIGRDAGYAVSGIKGVGAEVRKALNDEELKELSAELKQTKEELTNDRQT